APLLVRAQNDFGVAVGAEHLAQTPQLVPQLDIIVDLAVVDQGEAAVFAAHRHVPQRAEVENAQALVGQRARTELPDAAVVRPAVVLDLGHRIQGEHVLGRHLVTIETVDAGYTAHGLL